MAAENEALSEKLQAEEERRKLVLTDNNLVTHIRAGYKLDQSLPVFHWADLDTNNLSQAQGKHANYSPIKAPETPCGDMTVLMHKLLARANCNPSQQTLTI